MKSSSSIDWTGVNVLTFDCYGTLIDWETGILETLHPVLQAQGVHLHDSELLELYAEVEREAEEPPFRNYKSVLGAVMEGFAKRFGFQVNNDEADCLAKSLKYWAPFPDTVESLTALKQLFRLAVISNVDDDLFAFTQQRLGISFDWVITAEQVKSYKPSLNNFQVAFKRIGIPKEHIVHVAQSLHHDIGPGRELGLRTVWVNRRHGQQGSGATVPGNATSDLEVPDLHSLVTHIQQRIEGKVS